MADIFIPGSEMDEVRQSLGFVLDNIDIGNAKIDFGRALDYPLEGAASHFEKKWGDGRTQLKKQASGIEEAIDNIMDSFNKTDNDAVSNLEA
ncbi:hypothetical protein [Streptomyces sp. AK02-01A]|uniref:hypothetical protein n=1 Tax=Streptomyces sp. AK02-01A TaxID=3028648 RepID=UPI0029B3BDB6|nr:hypothetical protein [Streptomyces sp. AK02-01A]MDX3854568.1 hypothetical protein [Streptomyces sp. AK02-01A]